MASEQPKASQGKVAIVTGAGRRFCDMRAETLGKTYDEVYSLYAGETALKRIPAADEIAVAIVSLASDMASATTGQSLEATAVHYFH